MGLGAPQPVGSFPDQESNPCPLHWQVDSADSTPGLPGKSHLTDLYGAPSVCQTLF